LAHALALVLACAAGLRLFLSYNYGIEKVRTCMETVLWALDLMAVVYACFWALRQDSDAAPTSPKGK